MGVSILESMIEYLVGGLTGIATGIGEGLNTLVQSIFLTTSADGGTELSIYGGIILAFAGVSLAVGLSRMVVSWLTSLGN